MNKRVIFFLGMLIGAIFAMFSFDISIGYILYFIVLAISELVCGIALLSLFNKKT